MSNPSVLSAAFKTLCVRTYRAGLAVLLLAVLTALPALAGNMILNTSGGTASLGSDFVVNGSSIATPAGTQSFDCHITSSGGTGPVTYHCSAGSYSFTSTDGTVTVNGAFTAGTLVETAYGGGRGGQIHYIYQFNGTFSGVQTLNGVTAAIIGETFLSVGPLTTPLGSAPAGPGASGVNWAYSPVYYTDSSFSQLVRSDDIFGTNKVTFGGTGTGPKHFYGPTGITVDSAGRIYVADVYNCRIDRMDDMKGTNWVSYGRCGSGTGQFGDGYLADLALDASGRIYIADNRNNRIVRMDNMTGTNWVTLGTAGSGVNQFLGATGVTVDSAGKIYIADSGNSRIVRVDDMTGTNWTTLHQVVIGSNTYTFGAPAHVAIDPNGRIVVGDGSSVIRVDDMTGANWTTLNVGTTVAGVAMGADGTFFVAGVGSTGPPEVMFDDLVTGAGFQTSNMITYPGGVYVVPLPNPVPAITFGPGSMAFGNQNVGTTSAAQNATLTNFGSAPLTITGIVPPADFVAGGTCGSSLPGGSNCTISVSYAPSKTGAEAGTVTISDNAANGGTQTISVSGTGTAPVAGIAPASLTFQQQAVGTTSGGQLVVLSNSGTGPLTLTGAGISMAGDYSQTNDCGASLAPGTSCAITVTFTPSTTGTRTGSVVVTDDAGTQSVSLTGTGAGTAPSITASPESLFFPTQFVNTKSASQSVTLTNGGATKLSVTVTISGDFTKSGACPLSLNPGASCTISVTFAPTAGGTRTGTLTFTLPSGPLTVALTGTGTAIREGWVTASPTSVTFNNGYVVGDNPSQDVTVTNTNGVAIGLGHVAISGSSVFTQTNTCGTTLAAGASCTVTVTFMPTVAGTFTGTLSISESAGTSHKVPLSGTASNSGGL